MDRPNLTVWVRHYGPSSYADLAPLLDELKLRFGTVTARVTTPDGSGRGGGFGVPLDIVIEVVEWAGPVAAFVFKDALSEFAKDSYKGVRSAILAFCEKHRKPELVEGRMPFSIIVGGLQFVFDPPSTDDQFVAALNAARALADKLPDERVSNSEGPGGHFYTWDASSKTWQGPHHP